LGCDVSSRKAFEQTRHFIDGHDGIPGETWGKFVTCHCKHNHKSKIDFYYCRRSQIPEEQRVPLQELNRGVNQVGKQHGKSEDQDDAPGKVDGGTRAGEEQCGQQNVNDAALRESHRQLFLRKPGERVLPVGARRDSVEGTGSVFAIALNFGFTGIVSVRTIIAAVSFSAYNT
jgi:hypothetical protein